MLYLNEQTTHKFTNYMSNPIRSYECPLNIKDTGISRSEIFKQLDKIRMSQESCAIIDV